MGQCCSSGNAKRVRKPGDAYDSNVQNLSQETGLNMLELRSFYEEFLKDYPSGHLSKKEFRKVYKNFFPNDAKENQKVEMVFRTFDQNNDGTIDFREFMIALSVLSKGTLEQKLSLAFYLYDENGDGVLSYSEILGIVKAMYSASDEPEGNEGLPDPEIFAKGLFAELDEDGDGVVTLQEFIEVGCRDPTVGNLLLANVDEEMFG
uniref:Neurocalcin homolog n=1 Tax=Phallusia mammillata TaxID=59560 RepID=A0A6F9DLA1_9ASCI|nr:neurocalcin homolog [Phallusia mammillata]